MISDTKKENKIIRKEVRYSISEWKLMKEYLHLHNMTYTQYVKNEKKIKTDLTKKEMNLLELKKNIDIYFEFLMKDKNNSIKMGNNLNQLLKKFYTEQSKENIDKMNRLYKDIRKHVTFINNLLSLK